MMTRGSPRPSRGTSDRNSPAEYTIRATDSGGYTPCGSCKDSDVREGKAGVDLGSFEAISFDCYGTLIDWESGILSALRPLLQAHGRAFEDEALLEAYARAESTVQAGHYVPYAEVLLRVMDALAGEYRIELTLPERRTIVESLGDWPAFADTAAALESLARHYRLGILSNIDDALFASTRRRLGVEFTWVVTAEQVGAYKPSRRNFEALRERTGLPPGRVLHAAQSLFHDIGPARELGFGTVWINRRAGQEGGGATPPSTVAPDLELPDLRSLAKLLADR